MPSCDFSAPSSSIAQMPMNVQPAESDSEADEADGEHGPERAIDLAAPDEAEEPGEEPHAPRLPGTRGALLAGNSASKARLKLEEHLLDLGRRTSEPGLERERRSGGGSSPPGPTPRAPSVVRRSRNERPSTGFATRSTKPSSTFRLARNNTVLSERPKSREITVGVTGS